MLRGVNFMSSEEERRRPLRDHRNQVREEWQAWRDIVNDRIAARLPLTATEMQEAQAALARSPEASIELKGSILPPIPVYLK
jgi:hypothetical protein